MISEAYKKEFKNRLESFLWRSLGLSISAVLAFILEELQLLSLPIEIVALIGLGISELTKFLNVSLPRLQAMKETEKDPVE